MDFIFGVGVLSFAGLLCWIICGAARASAQREEETREAFRKWKAGEE